MKADLSLDLTRDFHHRKVPIIKLGLIGSSFLASVHLECSQLPAFSAEEDLGRSPAGQRLGAALSTCERNEYKDEDDCDCPRPTRLCHKHLQARE
jgi:hypothetical protein